MRIAGSFPFFPHRFMVSADTRRREATSRIVIKSGRSESDIFGSVLVLYDMERIIVTHFEIVNVKKNLEKK